MDEKPDLFDPLQRALGYRFSNPALLEQALTHRSYSVECEGRASDNETLEFLGDAVLQLVISHELFIRHGATRREGELTRMRSCLVREPQLARISSRMGLASWVRLGKGEARQWGGGSPSILSDVFEAVLGAVYLDGGLPSAFAVVRGLFGDFLDGVSSGAMDGDYKSMLQEWTQERFHLRPLYSVKDVTGPDHSRFYTVILVLNGEMLAEGSGRSKKEAEQDAARKALESLLIS